MTRKKRSLFSRCIVSLLNANLFKTTLSFKKKTIVGGMLSMVRIKWHKPVVCISNLSKKGFIEYIKETYVIQKLNRLICRVLCLLKNAPQASSRWIACGEYWNLFQAVTEACRTNRFSVISFFDLTPINIFSIVKHKNIAWFTISEAATKIQWTWEM